MKRRTVRPCTVSTAAPAWSITSDSLPVRKAASSSAASARRVSPDAAASTDAGVKRRLKQRKHQTRFVTSAGDSNNWYYASHINYCFDSCSPWRSQLKETVDGASNTTNDNSTGLMGVHCASNPCHNGGRCVDNSHAAPAPGFFTCICPPKYQGMQIRPTAAPLCATEPRLVSSVKPQIV